jgi:hypothetical protein
LAASLSSAGAALARRVERVSDSRRKDVSALDPVRGFDSLENGVVVLWLAGLEAEEIVELARQAAEEYAAETERSRSGEALAAHARASRQAIGRHRRRTTIEREALTH